MTEVVIRGQTYPVQLPKLRDPRLQLAATIVSLQVIGQVGFHFQVSIAQILLAVGTSALLEIGIAFRQSKVLMWPASAMLTGNGVAFILRVPGTAHGDWWTLRGWWIFVGTSAISLLSKHVVRWRGEHVFNPSNIGLVICFLALGRNRAAPLDFWWGPTSAWLALALAVIVTGGFAILSRLGLLRVALGFWIAFAAGVGVLALSGHAMTARWHLGPIQGLHFWLVLITSPEVLVFLFFMITDPKTSPRGPHARVVYAVSIGVLAALLIAPMKTEYASKVALLGALAIVCVVRAFGGAALGLRKRVGNRGLALASAGALAAYVVLLVVLNGPSPSIAAPAAVAGSLPPVQILPSRGVQSKLTLPVAQQIESDLVSSPGVRVQAGDEVRMWLQVGLGQGPPTAVAQIEDATYHLHEAGAYWALSTGAARAVRVTALRTSSLLGAMRLVNVAPSVGLDFRQGSFRFGMSNEYQAMMGGGLCWLDYNGDGWLDLFAVNSYASADAASWAAHGGLPRSALFENVHGRFENVTAATHAGLAVQGDGCAAADLNGDGRPDLVVTTTTGVDILWNRPNGTFVREALPAHGWYTGVAVADVNGDGRPDIFVAGYTDPYDPVPGSLSGFPTDYAGVRDLLYLNEGDGHFREVGVQAGLESVDPSHGLGATFVDVNGDGRPDLYVANDEDPNELYENVPWPGGAKADPLGLGFRFEQRASAEGLADPYAGMGIADDDGTIVVTNSRKEPSAAFRSRGTAFANDRAAFVPALGTGFAGWGASFVDLANSGDPDLVLAAGAIPVTSLPADAERMRVLAPVAPGSQTFGNAAAVFGSSVPRLNGRGVAAADVDNDGRMEIAVNSIGGRLLLLRPTGPVGHWLDVKLSRFSPGAVVTAELPDGRVLTQTVRAGGSYLSSEDPRVHFGLGSATRVKRLTVGDADGASSIADVRADRVVELAVPVRRVPSAAPPSGYRLPGCTASPHGSIATYWDEAAVDVLRAGNASQPVQARDLFDESTAAWRAWAAHTGDVTTALSFAAYRVLLWDSSFDSNLDRTFGSLTSRMRALCLSPDFTSTSGSSPAAIGNRIAAAVIAAGRRDGSLQSQHYVDPTYVPENAPLVLAQPGSTVHDPTFWQPLALAQKAAPGGDVPADVQTFVGAQWGRVRGFGSPPKAPAPRLGIPTDASYRNAAVAVIRATSHRAATVDSSPAAWSAFADALPGRGLAADVRLHLALSGALEDAAIGAWGAKRAYQSPRPISMIRYLAFNDQLPLVPGLIRKGSDGVEVMLEGRWVLGSAWTPPVPTPASPGWVAEGSAFAAAARRVLGAAAEHRASLAYDSGLADGIQLPGDETAGRTLGAAAGARANALAARYAAG